MLKEYPDVLTTKECREILGVGKNKIYKLLEAGELKGRKINRDWRVTKRNLKKYINNMG